MDGTEGVFTKPIFFFSSFSQVVLLITFKLITSKEVIFHSGRCGIIFLMNTQLNTRLSVSLPLLSLILTATARMRFLLPLMMLKFR